jgi:cell pole-organizing protein PopZ
MYLAVTFFAFGLTLVGADNKAVIASLRAQTESQAVTMRDLRAQVISLQARLDAVSPASTRPLSSKASNKQHEETLASMGKTSEQLQAVANTGADIRQLVLDNQKTELRRTGWANQRNADAVLAGRLQVMVASAHVAEFVLLWLIFGYARRWAGKS